MFKAALAVLLFLVVIVLTGCLDGGYPQKKEPSKIEQSREEEAIPTYSNRYNSDQDIGIINTAEYFDLHGEKGVPFSRDHFALLYDSRRLESVNDLKAALGGPLEIKEEEGLGGHTLIRLEYDQAYFVIDKATQTIVECNIEFGGIPGPRGVKIGDSVSAVIGKFYYEEKIMINKPDVFSDLVRENEYFACLYQLEPDSKLGLVIFDKEFGVVNRIMYGIHYGPHCGVSWLRFEFKDGLVSSIWFNAGW